MRASAQRSRSTGVQLSSSSTVWLALALLAAIALVALPLNARADCGTRADGTPVVNCEICAHTGGTTNQINDLKGVPRYNLKAKSIEKDPGAYTWYSCAADGTNCKWAFSNLDFGVIISGDSAHPARFENYVQGFLPHAGLPILCALLCIAIGVGLALCRYCCCCCRTRCIGGCCGSRFPTQKPPVHASCCKRWCSFGGVEPNHTAIADNSGDPKSRPPKWAYTRRDRLCSFFNFVSFVFCALLFIGLAFFSGVRQLPAAVTSVAENSPASLLGALAGTQGPLGDFLASLASDSIVNAMTGFNTTFASAVNLQDVLVQSDCVLGSVDGLPSTRGLEDFVTDTRHKLAGLVVRVAAIVPAIQADLLAQTANVRAFMNAKLITPLNALTDGVAVARNATLETNNKLQGFNNAVQAINSPVDGIPSINSDLAKLGQIPSTTTTNTLTSSTHASLSDYINYVVSSPGSNMNAADRALFVSRLTSMRDAYAALPHFNTTSSRLVLLDSRLDGLAYGGVITGLLGSIDTTTQDVRGLAVLVSGLTNATESFNRNIGSAFNFTNEYNLILGLNKTLYDPTVIPDFALLRREIGLLIDPLTASIIPCLTNLFGYVKAINATLLQLPSSMNVASDILSSVNGTLKDARVAVDEIVASLDDFETTRASLDLATWTAKLDQIKAQLLNQTDVLNGTYFSSVTDALTSTNALNFSTLVSQMKQFNATILSARPSNTSDATNKLDAFEAQKEALRTNLAQMLRDATEYTQGVCTSTTTPCTTSATCTGPATCDRIGAKRCHLQPLVDCLPDGTTIQDTDTFCNGGAFPTDYCLANPPRVQTLMLQLTASANGASALVTVGNGITSALNIISTASTAIDTSSMSTQLVDAASKLVATNTSQFFSALDEVTNRFNQFDFSSLTTQVSNLNDTIKSIDYTSTEAELAKLNTTLHDVQTNQVKPLRDSRALIYTFQQLLDVKFLSYTSQLSPGSLAAARGSGGVAGVLAAIATIVDDAALFLSSNQPLLQFNTSVLKDTLDARDKMNILFGQAAEGILAKEMGAVYQLTQLMGSTSSYLSPADPEWDSQARYDKTSANVAYAGNKKCVTNKCLKGSVEWMFGSKAGGGGASLKEISGGSIPLDLTREQVQALPLILPLIVIIFGCLAMALFRYTKCSSCCSSIALCLLFPFAALLFILSALLFPMLLMTGDMCMGMENLAYQFVVAQKDLACTSLAGGTGTASRCLFNSFNNTKVEVDIPQAVLNIFGGRCGPAEDSIAATWTAFGNSVAHYPTNAVNDFFDTQASKAATTSSTSDSLVIRPVLQAPLRAAATRGGELFQELVGRFGSESLSCSALHDAWVGTKAPFCCGVATTMYWSLGCVYLLAFTLLCCGFPALITGRKRFPAKAWGPFVTPEGHRYDASLSAIPGELEAEIDEALSGAEVVISSPSAASALSEAALQAERARMEQEQGEGAVNPQYYGGENEGGDHQQGPDGTEPVTPSYNPYILRGGGAGDVSAGGGGAGNRLTTPTGVVITVAGRPVRGNSRSVQQQPGASHLAPATAPADVHAVEMTRPRSQSFEEYERQQREAQQHYQLSIQQPSQAGQQYYVPGDIGSPSAALSPPSGLASPSALPLPTSPMEINSPSAR